MGQHCSLNKNLGSEGRGKNSPATCRGSNISIPHTLLLHKWIPGRNKPSAFLLKFKVNPAHTHSSMGCQEGKFGSCVYELPGASDVFFF